MRSIPVMPVMVTVLVSLCAVSATAKKPSKVPKRQIPPSVVAELRLMEHQFARALAQDCAPERCFAKGCVYLAHTVVDQPAAASLPGLGLDPGPGSVPRQVYLTTAECSFAHEKSVRSRDVRALANRLKAKLSTGWTQVEVVHEALQPIRNSLRESPEPPPETPPPAPEPEDEETVEPPAEPEKMTWEAPVALRELWVNLLPHFAWMIALVMLTIAALIVIWALRRLGRESPEEQALLAQMLNEQGAGGGGAGPAGPSGTGPPGEGDTDANKRVSEQLRRWRERLAKADGAEADPALRALVADLLRTGERELLAKAVMLFPDEFPKAFPQEGSLASAKLELAAFLKSVDPASLPSDEAFFDKLERYSLSSSLTSHRDTDLIRSLHDEFGSTALVHLLGAMPSRYGALLFALTPAAIQHEAVGLLNQNQIFQTVDQLMRSNRMDPVETAYLLQVLAALRGSEAIPAPPDQRAVSDRGTQFSATAALSVLLPRLDPETRGSLVSATASRLNGGLPTWIKGTLFGEMLLKLDDETRTDLLLEVDVNALAAWLRVQTVTARDRLFDAAPSALRAALSGAAVPASQGEQHALANAGREALSEALQRRLIRGDIAFEALLV